MKPMTAAVAALLAVTLMACADASAGSGATPSASPQASAGPAHAGRVLVRVSSEGGFVAPQHTFGTIPAFSLYADGTLITPGPQDAIYPAQALPAIWTRTATSEGVQAILQAAIDAGLSTAHDMTDLGNVGIADATTTVFTIDVDGSAHTVRVYALDELDLRPPGMSAEEFQARTRLRSLVVALSDVDAWLQPGAIGAATPYAAAEARLLVGPYEPDPQLPQAAHAWPLSTPLSDIGQPTSPSGNRCAVVSGRDWTEGLQPGAARANQLTPWTSDGAIYAIVIRPMLPDEHGC